jgi:hypothetical protein
MVSPQTQVRAAITVYTDSTLMSFVALTHSIIAGGDRGVTDFQCHRQLAPQLGDARDQVVHVITGFFQVEVVVSNEPHSVRACLVKDHIIT